MRSLPRLASALAVLLLSQLGCGSPAPPEPEPPPAPAPPPPLKAAREAKPVDAELLESARRIQADGREESCGPYRLLTDVRRTGLDGQAGLDGLCGRLAKDLDATYRRLFGLRLKGEPRETVFLFAEREDFRAFAREGGRLRGTYAGYASGAEGFVALHADGVGARDVARTLAHELTHLVHRRALGPGLTPWLSEGLADAIGDPATPGGLGPFQDRPGAEGPAKRLRGAYNAGMAPSLERLAALDRKSFDTGTVSFDYEQSALLVRFLLADQQLAPRFRAFLQTLAEGTWYRPERFIEALGISWPELDRRFEAWLHGE